MVGNFLAACNEHEAAAKLVSESAVQSPDSGLLIAMDTNFGVWRVDDLVTRGLSA